MLAQPELGCTSSASRDRAPGLGIANQPIAYPRGSSVLSGQTMTDLAVLVLNRPMLQGTKGQNDEF